MTTFNIEQHRDAFEQQCFMYFETLKARGWKAHGEGDGTPEALFWRQADGRYGVHSVERAWQGFIMGAKHYYPLVATYGGALQEIGALLKLKAGDDLTLMCASAIKELIAAASGMTEGYYRGLLAGDVSLQALEMIAAGELTAHAVLSKSAGLEAARKQIREKLAEFDAILPAEKIKAWRS